NRNKMTHLFLFTLGPVQSFIAQARKTQDLYAGSRLLSVLTETAMNHVKSKNGQITFPDSTIESKPNRFVAKIDLPAEQLKQLGEDVEQAVQAKWKSLAEKMLEKEGMRDPSGFYEQIQQHLKIHWVFHPIQNDYKTAFQQLEGLLAAVKQTSDFEQFPEVGRKCSVDGQLNVKFYRLAEGQNDNQVRKTHLFANDNLIFEYEKPRIALSLLQPGEGLSGVSMVKRSYKPNGTSEFESTADIALQKTIAFWEHNCRSKYDAFIGCFGEKQFDAQLFYEENLTQKYFEKQGLKNFISQLKDLQRMRRELEDCAKEKKYRLTKYYALLLFDGDGMGELLSGERLASGKKLEDFHPAFSTQLGAFAGAAQKFLNAEQRGRTVYAGGDDFLGFVNLESLFEVLAHFQCKFRELVSTPMQPYLKDANGITFSAGICIAHYKEPLSLVLNRARAMEQKAKDYRKSKNAFGIAVIKGSGEDHDTVWGFENSNPAKLEYLIESLRKEHFSNTFIKNFQREFAPVLKENEQVPTTMQEMFQIELTRLAERSCDLPNKKEKAARLCKMLWTDFFLSQQSESPKATLGNFFELLNICDFLHRTLNPNYEEQREQKPAA
ncbi:MAG TPA: type III-B CRISPR-associated protein Cas10/Cmr2, partial [Saprospiraceae bacterium]|nr:type III-B CRISPR-associated protein Cas10/Cmr2 [Saprospiraceae bacterium]